MGSYSFFADRPIDQYKKSDVGFSVAVILMLGFGLFTLYFCSQNYAARIFDDSFYFFRRQFICVLVGLLGFLILALMPLKTVRKFLPIITVFTLVICILTFVPGLSVEKNGARRWIKMPMNFTLQSSEVVKFTIIIYLANYFDKQMNISVKENRNVLNAVLVMLLFITLVLLQKDFSTSIFLFVFCCIFFWACGMKIRWIWFIGFLASLAFAYFLLSEEYRIERIISFLNPNERLDSGNYQSMAAKRAISAGGFWGAGIGSKLVQSNRIPEVQADYIFASWAEAMGFGGVICYFAMLGFFAWRGLKIALECKNRFAAFGAFGFISMIIFQTLINCGVVCGALPSTGIPLPFFSLGGSSIIITLCMCGFVVNASRCDSEDNDDIYDEYVELESIDGVESYE
ncbi:MAG: putative lipid II flippase FtsW [Treponema sp.]|nr:putative lipid II flippase FtsW [Treponema sp.]